MRLQVQFVHCSCRTGSASVLEGHSVSAAHETDRLCRRYDAVSKERGISRASHAALQSNRNSKPTLPHRLPRKMVSRQNVSSARMRNDSISPVQVLTGRISGRTRATGWIVIDAVKGDAAPVARTPETTARASAGASTPDRGASTPHRRRLPRGTPWVRSRGMS